MHIIIKNKILSYGNYKVKCAVGKRGIGIKLKEGDLITPKGIYKIAKIFLRKDRIKNFRIKIKTFPIKKNMGWCNDLKNEKNYNKLIKVNQKISHEKMYRFDKKYDLVIPIKYNFLKPKLGKGSAIFLHLTKNYKPTAGCIAVKEQDFLILLRLINKKTKIKIK